MCINMSFHISVFNVLSICMRVYVCVCVPHIPMHHIRQIPCSEDKLYVCLPLLSIYVWQPLSSLLSSIWSSMDKHISDI